MDKMENEEQFDYTTPELREFDYNELVIVHGDSCSLALSDGITCLFDNTGDE